LDANIILALAAGKEKEPDQFRLASEIFEKIKDGEYLGVISSLTLMEIMAVLRTQKGREQNNLKSLTSDKQIEYVLNESKKMYDNLMGEVMRLPNIKFELGKPVDTRKILDISFDIMQQSRGKVRFYDKCKKCGTKGITYSAFKGLGSDDMLHALIAKETGCDYLITFDSDFEELKNYEEIEPLEIMVLKW
jgi:predicted nucleic acid-binding protein